jgi:uncharacterized protein (DUF1697 family)
LTAYVALLRAVNVGGRKLIMSDLKAIADEAGLGTARTFIASGNLVFASTKSEAAVARLLEERLKAHMKAEVPVLVRTAAEMAAVVAANPFANASGSKVTAIFLDGAPSKDAIEKASGIADEELALGTREIYVHYPNGMADTKLRLPAASGGTARNMNTVAKLAAMAKEVE